MTWTPPPTHELTTPDGRTVTYCLYGPPTGTPLISLLGAPSTRWERPDMITAYNTTNLRVLVPDRPGYGGSTRNPNRKVADLAADIKALADTQNWDRFAITGHSAGAPHALACAALLPNRTTRCAVVAGLAPPDTPELDFFGQDRPGRGDAFRLAPQGEQTLRPYLTTSVQEAMANWPSDMDDGRRQRLRAAYAGLDGVIDDDLALIHPWGFDVTTITAPVGIWYSTTDPNIPHTHAKWLLKHVPQAEAHEYQGGHDPDPETTNEILTWLRT